MKNKRLIVILVTVVACLILLAFASPVFNKVAEVISSFAAGWGNISTTEEVSETQITDENGIPYTYPMFVDDLEYLSAEEMIEINEAYEAYLYERVYGLYYNAYIHNGAMSESEVQALAHKEAEIEVSDDDHRFFNENNIRRYKYYGVFGEYVVLVQQGNLAEYAEYAFAEYIFGYGSNATMLAYKNGIIYELAKAYEMGWLTDKDIGDVYERYKAYDIFEKEMNIHG
jgi:hypothetical protein